MLSTADLIHSPEKVSLHDAVRKKDKALVKKLLAAGIDINAQDYDGDTALHIAIQEAEIEDLEKPDHMVGLLLDHDANIYIENEYNESAIHTLAAYHKHFLFKVFDVRFFDFHTYNYVNSIGSTIMHSIAATNGLTMFEFLFQAKSKSFFNLNKQDVDGNTPVHIAVLNIIYNNADDQLLIKFAEYQADFSLKNKDGDSPIDLLIQAAQLKETYWHTIMRILLELKNNNFNEETLRYLCYATIKKEFSNYIETIEDATKREELLARVKNGENAFGQIFIQEFQQKLQAANLGDKEAQCDLGWFFHDGIVVEKDKMKSLEWFRKAAKQGHVNAQSKLACCYEEGFGISINYKKAFKWMHRAAQKGDPVAQSNLGLYFLNGTGIEKDEKQSVEWYRKAASQEDPEALFQLGKCIEQGVGADKNDEEALGYYRRAANLEMKKAQHRLNGIIAFNTSYIEAAIAKSKISYGKLLKNAVDQVGPTCGPAAFAAAVNGSGYLPKPIYATLAEKPKSKQEEKNHDDVVVEHFKGTSFEALSPTECSLYSIKAFNISLEKINSSISAEESKVPGEAVILPKNCTEEEYQAAIFDALKKGCRLIVPFDEKNGLPGNEKGKSTHYGLLSKAWIDENNICYVAITHHGYHCIVRLTDLYNSNKQLPRDNPRLPGGNLDEYRFTFFKVHTKDSSSETPKPAESLDLKLSGV